MKPEPSIATIILNWNGLEDTIECVNSILDSNYENVNIIVVDNNSRGDDVESLESEFGESITLLENSQNLGFAGGNNVGIRWAIDNIEPEYIYLLNNDMVVSPESFSQLVSIAEERAGVAVYGPCIAYDNDRDVIWSAGLETKNKISPFKQIYKDEKLQALPDGPFEVDKIIGAAFFMPRSSVETVGYLDTDFFLYHEESEWCHRAREAGLSCVVVPSAKVFHKVSRSARSDTKIPSYYHPRNKILFAYKTEPLPVAIPVALRQSFRDLVGTLLGYTDWQLTWVFIGIFDGLFRNRPRVIPE